MFTGVILFLSTVCDFSLENNLKGQEFEEDELVESSKFSYHGQEVRSSGGDDVSDAFLEDELRHLITWGLLPTTFIFDSGFTPNVSIALYLEYCCLKINC